MVVGRLLGELGIKQMSGLKAPAMGGLLESRLLSRAGQRQRASQVGDRAAISTVAADRPALHAAVAQPEGRALQSAVDQVIVERTLV